MSALDELDDEQIDPLFGDYPDVDERSCRLLGPTALVRGRNAISRRELLTWGRSDRPSPHGCSCRSFTPL